MTNEALHFSHRNGFKCESKSEYKIVFISFGDCSVQREYQNIIELPLEESAAVALA